MTQAEYNAIAILISDVWTDEYVETSWEALDRAISGLSDIFEQDPSFDREKFGDICTGD